MLMNSYATHRGRQRNALQGRREHLSGILLESYNEITPTSFSDEPEIEVEAEKVHSGLGKEAHLTCIVHGEPRPLVSSSG